MNTKDKILTKNPENYEWKRPGNNKISVHPDGPLSEKINEILNILSDREISVSTEKVLKFVIRNIKAGAIENKRIFSKKQHDEIMKKAKEKATIIWE